MGTLKTATGLMAGALTFAGLCAPTAQAAAATPFPVSIEIFPLVTYVGNAAGVGFTYNCSVSVGKLRIVASLTQPSGATGSNFSTKYTCTGQPNAVVISVNPNGGTGSWVVGAGTASVKIQGAGYTPTTVTSPVELL
ncbi:hypothetical protein ACIPLC_11875 [Kitasatospora sp. NPDC086801]|uniref:hypothetical protein n=1 Tax=Kitasatospora sp. NPDC086801 TaxID=3364066 RepID=UPI0038058258